MKECIRCGNTEKDIRKNKIKTCYVGWGSYKRHDYSKTESFKEFILTNLKNGLLLKKKKGKTLKKS